MSANRDVERRRRAHGKRERGVPKFSDTPAAKAGMAADDQSASDN
jgi:hypothetical protein